MAVTPGTQSATATTVTTGTTETTEAAPPAIAPASPTPLEIPIPVIPGEHPNEGPRLTPVPQVPGKALYKQILPGVMQVPVDLVLAE